MFIIIIIIIIIIFLKKKSNNFTNNIKKNESFESIQEPFATITKDYFALTLSGCTIATLYQNNTNLQNQFLQKNWDTKQLAVGLTNTTYNVLVDNPYKFVTSNANIMLNLDNIKGSISGLNVNKLYKLDVFVTLYNINIPDSAGLSFNMTVKKLKVPNISTTTTTTTIPGSANNYEDFPIPLVSNAYQLPDFFEMTFPISAFITNCTEFSIFINCTSSSGVVALTSTNQKFDAANTLITVSLLEI